MRISNRLLLPIMMITLLGTHQFWGARSALAGNGNTIVNPLRAASEPSVRVSTTFGSSIARNAKPTTPQPTQDSSNTKRPETGALAIDAIAPSRETKSQSDNLANSELLRSGELLRSSELASANKNSDAVLPPTIGRFIARADHWVFLPERTNSVLVMKRPSPRTLITDNTFRTASAIKALQTETLNTIDLAPTNPLRSHQQPWRRYALDRDFDKAKPTNVAIAEFVITPNLMLERVAELIETSGSARWVVSGQISSITGQPSLSIRTAEVAVD